jgi:hypothetical protein
MRKSSEKEMINDKTKRLLPDVEQVFSYLQCVGRAS